MGVFYISREAFQSAALVDSNSLSNRTIDRLLESKSRAIEDTLNRHFYPHTQVRYYDWPPQFGLTPIRLYLNADLLSVTSLTVGGTRLTPLEHYFLEPINYATDGGALMAYSRIEIDLTYALNSFVAGYTPQRSIVVTGDWGYCQRTAPAGALASSLDGTSTSVEVTDSSAVGVGDLVRVDDEQVIVTEKALLDTGVNTTGALTADNSNVAVLVDDGTQLNPGEVIAIDSERMFIESVSSDTLTVTRAYQGSVLATHDTDADVYAPRTLTVERGAVGTTAATHDSDAGLLRNVPPQLIADLCLAEAVSTFHQEKAGYARTIGQGETTMMVTGAPLNSIRKQVEDLYGRQRGPLAI